jgi:hypothetical protein
MARLLQQSSCKSSTEAREIEMNAMHEPTPGRTTNLPDSEAFPELISATLRMIERGDAIEAYRAYDDGVLAEVPHALEAYMNHQRFDLN